jgi:hypothetical protein
MRSSPSRPGEHAAAGTEAEGGRGCRKEREREGAKAAGASVMAGRRPDRRAMRREDDGGCARRQAERGFRRDELGTVLPFICTCKKDGPHIILIFFNL